MTDDMTKIRKKRVGNNKPLRTAPYPSKDLTGKKINRLSVLQFEEYKSDFKGRRKVYYRCKCDCGNEVVISGNRLTGKEPQMSCGCALKEYREWAKTNFRPPNTKPPGEAAFNDLYERYKLHAQRIDVDFLLSKDQFRELTKQNCFYCGIVPSQIAQSHSRRKYNGGYIHNGIDRKDNNLGYRLDNVVACCGICNKAKRNLSLTDFLSWIDRLTKFRMT